MLPLKVIAESELVKILYVKDNELFIGSDSGGQARQITSDGVVKFLPAWSKDGSRIAFIERVDGGRALGNLVVINEEGQLLSSVLFRRAEDWAGGMRFIESLEWLDRDRIALSGSANPSLTETAIVDLSTRTEEGGIFDDGPGANFSPDGKHFAYTSGSPHFTPESSRRPTLNVDHVSVFPKEGVHVRLMSDRYWSPDSSRLAVIFEDFSTRRQSLVVWGSGGRTAATALPTPAGSESDLSWSDGDVLITFDHEALRVVKGSRNVERLAASKAALSPLDLARAERGRLLEIAKGYGGRDLDFWCQACALNALPRKVSTNGN